MRRFFRGFQLQSIEVFLALLCLLSGLPILLNPAMFAPASVLALLPLPFVALWGLALTLGGLLDLIGIGTGNVYLRRAGLILLSAGALIMSVTIVALTGYTRLFNVGVYLAFAWATGSRYWELGKLLKVKRKLWERHIKE